MNSPATDALGSLRAQMEEVDRELVTLLARRQQLAAAIAHAKRAAGRPIVDLAREAAVVRTAAAHARSANLDEEAVRHIFWCLIDLSRRSQLGASA